MENRKVQRELPVFTTGGTDFSIDIESNVFRQKDNPHNCIPLSGVKEEFRFSFFYYDTHTKNLYKGSTTDLPERVSIVIVPPLKELDPVGLARKRGLPDNHFRQKDSKAHPLLQFTRQGFSNEPKNRLKL